MRRSQGPDAARRALLHLLPVGGLALSAGCTSLLGGDTPAVVQYVLDDRGIGAAAPVAAPRIERGLLVAPVQAASDVFQQVVVVKMAATWRICHAQT